VRSRCAHRIAELTLTPKTPAAPLAESPSPTAATTRSRKSIEYALAMIGLPVGETTTLKIRARFESPQFSLSIQWGRKPL
jgi:hypothetical protein